MDLIQVCGGDGVGCCQPRGGAVLNGIYNIVLDTNKIKY